MPNLTKLKAKARTVNIFFRFHRNNPRTTAYIYNRLISEIGIAKLKAEKELRSLENGQASIDSETIKTEIKNVLKEFCEKADKMTSLYEKEVEKE